MVTQVPGMEKRNEENKKTKKEIIEDETEELDRWLYQVMAGEGQRR